jgi:CRP-like cAMP-binding protein
MSSPLTESCIVHQFQKFADLNQHEISLLQALEKDPRNFEADQPMAIEGGKAERFFTLQSGWACAMRTGQILGLREISFDRNLSEFRTLTEVRACPFPRQRLTEIFDQAPRLTDLFFLILAREQSMLIERVINIGRRSAVERLAHFIVEMKVRLNVEADKFELPMNQTIIGDTLSLSSVHVSRTFKVLRDEGLLESNNGDIHILDLEGLIDISGFDRNYLESHSNWARED